MLLALFCGFFVNLIKKSLTTRFGTVPSVDPVDVTAVCAECDPAVQRTAHQRHDPVPVHLCHL